MKRCLFLCVLFSVCLIFSSHAPAHDNAVDTAAVLPKGLEKYYPPNTEGPVYLFRMLTLEGLFSGIAAEITEDDLEGARGLFPLFKTEYMAMKNMVAEWEEDFPVNVVEALGNALTGTDKNLMFAAFGGVGRVCHQCHVTSMVAVQQKYRWGNFAGLTVEDGGDGGRKPYDDFKKSIAVNMAGVRIDAAQGQWDSARNHFSMLQKRFAALTNTCTNCHAEEPKNFTDPPSLPLLENELLKDQPDKGKIDDLLQGLGGQSCANCHLIHVPAAMAITNYGRTTVDRKE